METTHLSYRCYCCDAVFRGDAALKHFGIPHEYELPKCVEYMEGLEVSESALRLLRFDLRAVIEYGEGDAVDKDKLRFVLSQRTTMMNHVGQPDRADRIEQLEAEIKQLKSERESP